jgi:V/A-type H+-transporting ATPase subunit C
LLASERARAWALVGELVPDAKPFELFRLAADYHNLKAAIKLHYTNHPAEDVPRYLLTNGTIPADVIVKAVADRDGAALPPEMAEVAQRAYEALMHTGSGQAADFAVERARLRPSTGRERLAQPTDRRLRAHYGGRGGRQNRAARCGHGPGAGCAGDCDSARRQPGQEFTPRGGANRKAAILELLDFTEYAGAAAEGRRGIAALERWFDDYLMERLGRSGTPMTASSPSRRT